MRRISRLLIVIALSLSPLEKARRERFGRAEIDGAKVYFVAWVKAALDEGPDVAIHS